MITAARDHLLLLPTELRWLIRLRWFAAGAIVLLGAAHGLWSGWSDLHTRAVALGGVVMLYNALFVRFARGHAEDAHQDLSGLLGSAALQILLDLIALTLLSLWTGGVTSPLLGLYVLHMVFGSLLLPAFIAYGVAGFAVGLMLVGLALTDQFPRDAAPALAVAGWTLTLLLTVFLTGHLTDQLRRREAARRDQQRRLQSIVDTAADGIIIIDQSGTIQSANPATARIFGFDPAELLGRNISMLMPTPDRAAHDDYLANYLRTGRAKIIGIGRELLGRRKNGEIFPLELAVSETVLHEGRIFTGIVRDISQRKRREREVEALNERLMRQQQALFQSEKMAAMGRMAAGITHEIANPVASMDCVLQLAARRSGGLDEASIAALREQVVRIEQVIRELTAFSHPNGRDWRVMKLSDIIADALHMLRFEHRLRRVQVRCECDPRAGEARVLPSSMQQVLVNIILNALDAMEDVTEPQLTLRARSEGEWRIIEIADNGHGITAEDMESVFDPFFTTKPPGRGTGLGLSISMSLVQRHGGRCEVTSAPGAGTTFRILLPKATTTTPDERPPVDGSGCVR